MTDIRDSMRASQSLRKRVSAFTRDSIEQMKVSTYFTHDAQDVLRFFYDERYKERKEQVPKFALYASFCERCHVSDWFRRMMEVDQAIRHLIELGYIRQAAPAISQSSLEMMVGKAAEHFELTEKGLEILQGWHPPITLRLKAWIAVMPPWLVLLGTIAGAIAAMWKIADLLFFHP